MKRYYQNDYNVKIILDLLLVNPAGFWGAMMDEMVGYMSGRGESSP